MEPVQVVARYFERMQARDWDGVRALLDDGVVVDWLETAERFVGADAVIGMNADYPEGWQIRVLRLVEQGSLVVAEIEVPQDGVGLFRAAAFVEVAGDRIVRSVEYWVTVGGADPPSWRAKYAQPIPDLPWLGG